MTLPGAQRGPLADIEAACRELVMLLIWPVMLGNNTHMAYLP